MIEPSRFIEFGIQRHCNAPALWDYVEAKKVEPKMTTEDARAN